MNCHSEYPDDSTHLKPIEDVGSYGGCGGGGGCYTVSKDISALRDRRHSKSKEKGILAEKLNDLRRQGKASKVSSPSPMLQFNQDMNLQDIEKGSLASQDSRLVKTLALISTLLLLIIASFVLAMFFNARPFGSSEEVSELPEASKNSIIAGDGVGVILASSDKPTIIQSAMKRKYMYM